MMTLGFRETGAAARPRCCAAPYLAAVRECGFKDANTCDAAGVAHALRKIHGVADVL